MRALALCGSCHCSDRCFCCMRRASELWLQEFLPWSLPSCELGPGRLQDSPYPLAAVLSTSFPHPAFPCTSLPPSLQALEGLFSGHAHVRAACLEACKYIPTL